MPDETPLPQHASVVVIGGGNTAIDAARTAVRGGAHVTLAYRRTMDQMPAVAEEVRDAIAEGVEFEFLVAPTEVERVAGQVRGLAMQQMELGEPDESGRRRPVPVPGEVRQIEADTVMPAFSPK